MREWGSGGTILIDSKSVNYKKRIDQLWPHNNSINRWSKNMCISSNFKSNLNLIKSSKDFFDIKNIRSKKKQNKPLPLLMSSSE